MWTNSTFETEQYDTIGFSRKNSWNHKKWFLIFCPSSNVAPKQSGQSRSHSISRVPLQISLAHFFVFDLLSKLWVDHIRKNLKFSFSQKWLQRFPWNFVGILHIWTSTIWNYRLFPKKSLKVEKLFLIFNPLPNVEPKPTGRSRSHSIPRVPVQISLAHIFVFDLPPKLRVGLVHIRKNLNFSFSQKWLQRFSSNFVGLLYIRTPTIWHSRLFPKKSL